MTPVEPPGPRQTDEAATMTGTTETAWLVVDVMNVVGSRPDGWWRDRVGAAVRLVDRLARHAAATGRPITAVIDGSAGPRLPDGVHDGVEVVHAGRGRDAADDEILARLATSRRAAEVVTADRDLARRARSLGAVVSGPTVLLEHLDRLDDD